MRAEASRAHATTPTVRALALLVSEEEMAVDGEASSVKC